MKKIILIIILIIPAFCIHAQLSDNEKHSLDSLLKTGKLNQNQVIQLQRKWVSLHSPVFKVNESTGEIYISDILSFTNLDKKAIFQRCLEWIAINYGNLVHSDLESGKIIANGLIDLTHYAETPVGFGSMKISQIQTSTSYTLILTLKDNKLKYTITNITFNFRNFSEAIDEISYPITSIYPAKELNQNWLRFFTIVNASSEMFNVSLKNSLIAYLNDAENDYSF
jgi:hypothetical protein